MVETRGPGGPSHEPGPSLWPLGLAIGITVVLVGLVIGNWVAVGVGAVLLLGFGFVWLRDIAAGVKAAPTVHDAEPGGPETDTDAPPIPAHRGGAALPPMEEGEVARYPRSTFLEGATLGLGGVITGLVALPVAGFAVLPAFVDQSSDEIDLGPITDYPEGQFVIATFLANPEEGEVSRRTAFVRNNGIVDGRPSFTLLSNRCVHLGCPVQVNGLTLSDDRRTIEPEDAPPIDVTPTQAAVGFGCPCHGGQYDIEGNRTAGPPVRALDRYAFAIRDGRLILTQPFSVSHVEGEGAEARIKRYQLANPGVHVEGLSSWLYPFAPPS